ncbi:MAG TPA: 2Fe-2S iron-sulfur cluster-binding protein, partial [Aestuariivirga sp.]|nr:2Fe-2S iron-sulfur cluster-binding protein [Aestuariivirga sp.]
MTDAISFLLNGRTVNSHAEPSQRLTQVLRHDMGLTGTKVGCDAGDCGACTVLIDGELACACLVSIAQVGGAQVVTIEGLQATKHWKALQQAFLHRGAAQCGICTPGMLVSAARLLERDDSPDARTIADALGGVLCRCTGYRKIIDAVSDAAARKNGHHHQPPAGRAVGAHVVRLDGEPKISGLEAYGADNIPEDALFVRAVRSPYHRASFVLGDLESYRISHSGIVRVLTSHDVPGNNIFGVLAAFADQPVFAVNEIFYRGEAVAAVVGERHAIEALDLSAFPVTWTELKPGLAMDDALSAGAPLLHAKRAGNILIEGRVARGDVDSALASAAATVEAEFETGFVEHAYVEPEAGWARRVGDRMEVTVSTQSPYLDRDSTAGILGITPESVRIIPSACGGGFGAKLDLSVQPFVAIAAWV